ncbi:MAG: polysaccharide deacetylase family protein, partial [Erysipelotrichaceae bacterium]|nr:polysaccharide deacetylase family protein [Erysipelotrichaceae bacterium]
SEEGRMIISDYLRYSMKRDELDEAYSYDFLKATYYKDLKIEDLEFGVDGKDLTVTYRPYDYSFRVPLKYMQGPASIDLGYENELYQKPRYVSKERRMIAFTFDDGPDISLKTSGQIVDRLYLFDSSSTFFILGNRLGEKQIAFCREAVEKGIEYGSHTQSHADLVKLSSSEAYNEIMIPYHDLYDNQYGFGYRMKLFRPPYGSRNAEVDHVTELIPVLWNVDSLDWSYRTSYGHDECVDVISEKVISEADENDVVLFHDIYQTSADAVCRLIEYYIREGYQIVSVSEMIEALGLENVTYFSGK